MNSEFAFDLLQGIEVFVGIQNQFWYIGCTLPISIKLISSIIPFSWLLLLCGTLHRRTSVLSGWRVVSRGGLKQQNKRSIADKTMNFDCPHITIELIFNSLMNVLVG